MGVAAYNRGSRSIAAGLAEAGLAKRETERIHAAIKSEYEANEWRRRAWDWLIEAKHDGKGFAGGSAKQFFDKNGRTLSARLRRVSEAQRVYIDTDSREIFACLYAAIQWARAVYSVLDYVSGQFNPEILLSAPRSVSERPLRRAQSDRGRV